MKPLLFLFLFLAASPAGAAVSGGGAFSLERSWASSAGFPKLSTGTFILHSAAGSLPASAQASHLANGTSLLGPGFLGSPLLLSPSLTHTISLLSGRGLLTLNAQSVPAEYEVLASADPISSPIVADPNIISAANQKIRTNQGEFSREIPDGIIELGILSNGSFFSGPVEPEATLQLSYPDAEGDGGVDGTSPPVRASTLALYVLDETHRLWVRLAGSKVDLSQKRVSASIGHFSVFGLFGASDAEVSRVFAFPVPYRPNDGNPDTGTPSGGITFTNLPGEGDIRIYTLSGELVRTIPIPTGLFPPQLNWNVKTDTGKNVVSGVYLWQVQSGGNRKTGKLMIIR